MQRFSLWCRAGLIGGTFIFSGLLAWHPALADFVQQGPKLVGLGTAGLAQQGQSVALSADGNTAIVGGPVDSGGPGAAWVFVRSNGVWSPQGGKLFGLGAGGDAFQGYSVALSADGSTAIVGGPSDSGQNGAAWVFTRSNGVWSPQGSKLVGGPGARFGNAVALSADGNTALIGGPNDGGTIGAGWVFTRAGSTWTQQGKLVGQGGGSATCQGASVALSADGNTAVLGGPCDGGNIGATWVFARNAGAWTQYGNKLVGSFPSGPSGQGTSVALSGDGQTLLIGGPNDNLGDLGAAWVFMFNNGVWTEQTKLIGFGGAGTKVYEGRAVALSADGNLAIIGGWNDNTSVGAVWVFTRSNGVWTQQGAKLLGSGSSGPAEFGLSVALSSTGSTALIGGPADNGSVGATWVFIPPTNTHDFNGNTLSDIAWRDGGGNVAAWLMSGVGVASSAELGNVPTTTWSIVGQRDFDGDGKADLLWHDTSGNTSIWFLNGTQVASSASIGNIPTTWAVIATGDFNDDGKGDILWRDTSGNVAVWLMNGAAVSSTAGLGNVPSTWSVVGTGDFNADGTADLLWRDISGNMAIWFMNGTQVASAAGIGNIPTSWSVAGTGDFNGDSFADIVWHDDSGNTSIWLMNGAAVMAAGGIGDVPTTWAIAQTGDYNGDGMSDLLWRDNLGNVAMWFMNGAAVSAAAGVGNIPTVWTVQAVNAE